jgi:hypothetical protein
MEQQQVIEQAGQVVNTPGFQQAAQMIAQQGPAIARTALETAAAVDTMQGKRQSPAQARLERARQADKAAGRQPFEPTEGGVFLRRLTWPESERVHLTASRTGTLDIRRDAVALRAFTICVLEACVYSGASADAKYFKTLHEAAEWADSLDPELQELTRTWRDAALKISPLLMPRAVLGEDVPAWRDEAEKAADEAALQELLQDVPSRPVETTPSE